MFGKQTRQRPVQGRACLQLSVHVSVRCGVGRDSHVGNLREGILSFCPRLPLSLKPHPKQRVCAHKGHLWRKQTTNSGRGWRWEDAAMLVRGQPPGLNQSPQVKECTCSTVHHGSSPRPELSVLLVSVKGAPPAISTLVVAGGQE